MSCRNVACHLSFDHLATGVTEKPFQHIMVSFALHYLHALQLGRNGRLTYKPGNFIYVKLIMPCREAFDLQQIIWSNAV
jgi:hypothetical protein